MARLQGLLAAYGPVALGVWLALFGLTWLGFSVLIATGLKVEGMAAGAGTVGGAYLATQASKPLRVLATLALTPPLARLMGRRPKPAVSGPAETPVSERREGG